MAHTVAFKLSNVPGVTPANRTIIENEIKTRLLVMLEQGTKLTHGDDRVYEMFNEIVNRLLLSNVRLTSPYYTLTVDGVQLN